jgi:hypothetical protein
LPEQFGYDPNAQNPQSAVTQSVNQSAVQG